MNVAVTLNLEDFAEYRRHWAADRTFHVNNVKDAADRDRARIDAFAAFTRAIENHNRKAATKLTYLAVKELPPSGRGQHVHICCHVPEGTPEERRIFIDRLYQRLKKLLSPAALETQLAAEADKDMARKPHYKNRIAIDIRGDASGIAGSFALSGSVRTMPFRESLHWARYMAKTTTGSAPVEIEGLASKALMDARAEDKGHFTATEATNSGLTGQRLTSSADLKPSIVRETLARFDIKLPNDAGWLHDRELARMIEKLRPHFVKQRSITAIFNHNNDIIKELDELAAQVGSNVLEYAF